jgi:16S rRNA (cytosine967-C5)-methyltransferase
MRPKPREIAFRVLTRHAPGGYVEDLLEGEAGRHSLAPADRRLVQNLVYGVVRWQATLDWLIDRQAAGCRQVPALRLLLRLGLYQLFWLDRVPDHAAVHESVQLVKALGYGRQAGFVNALLRGYARRRAATLAVLADLKRQQPALGWSHPDWLCTRWERRWGGESLARLLEWNNSPPKTFARLNSLKTDPDRLAARWQEEGVRFAPQSWDWTDEGLVYELADHPPLGQLPSLQAGWFYVQDPSTLLAVRELGAEPTDNILDACAAPGGKTTFLAQCLQNRGHIVAQDAQPGRLELLRDNCARLGVTNVEARLAPEPASPFPPQEFDRILVDVPCSNTGVLRRRVDARWRLRAEHIHRASAAQLALLKEAAAQLKPGGTLVYSTCSLETEENREVVDRFLARNPRFRLERDRTLLPFVDGVDGAYVARLTRDGP